MKRDLLSLPNYKLRDIECICRSNDYLGNETLYEQVEFDKAVLRSLGFNYDDVYTNFQNVKLLLNKTNDYREFTTLTMDNKHLKKVMSIVPKSILDKTCESTVYNQIDINGRTLVIYCQTMIEYDECKLSKHFEGKSEIYDKYYFVVDPNTGKSIWLSELVMEQVNNYGLFHGVSSEYRVDPVKYIEVFGMKGTVDKVKTCTECRWRYLNEITGNIHDVTQKNTGNNEYDAFGYQGETKMCIRFKNKQWLDSHIGDKIEVFGVPLVLEDYEPEKWHEHNIVKEQFIDHNDTSELNNIIALSEKELMEKHGKMFFDDIINMIEI